MAELDKSGSNGSSGAMDKDDVIKFFGEEDTDEKETIPLTEDKKEPVKKEAKKEDKEPDKTEESDDDELKEIEKELERPDEKNLDLTSSVSKTAVLKKYPSLFKDFPDLQVVLDREQVYTEKFPTLKDADNALRDSETLNQFEADLAKGETANMLMAAKKADLEAFNRIVDDYLITLGKVDEKAYYHVLGNTIRHTVQAMLTEAKSSSDEKLQEAAEILNLFIFGSTKIEPPTKLAKARSRDDNTNNNDKQVSDERFETVSNDLYTKINKSIKNTVEANIDPQNKLREYDKRNATRDAIEELESLLTKDTRFKVIVDKLWRDAAESNHSKASIDKIQSLFYAKIKSLLPPIIKRARGEAIRGKKADLKPEAKNEDKKDKKVTEPTRSSQATSKPGVIPKGMSTLDFLNAED